MKCRVSKCNACCCYNIPFERGELSEFADKIVNPVLFSLPMVGAQLAVTHENPAENKCPFLRSDFRCNIYASRPDVCRKFGEIAELKCEFLK